MQEEINQLTNHDNVNGEKVVDIHILFTTTTTTLQPQYIFPPPPNVNNINQEPIIPSFSIPHFLTFVEEESKHQNPNLIPPSKSHLKCMYLILFFYNTLLS